MILYVLLCFVVCCLSQVDPFDTLAPIEQGDLPTTGGIAPLAGTETYEIGCFNTNSRCIYTVIVKNYDIFQVLSSETRLECNTTCKNGSECVFNETCPVCQETTITNIGTFVVQRNCSEFTDCVEPKSNCTASLIGDDPGVEPTLLPTVAPTQVATNHPTQAPTLLPTLAPTDQPTQFPTLLPTMVPTNHPTQTPTLLPTMIPTNQPTQTPTNQPTQVATLLPTMVPTNQPTQTPTLLPTMIPTNQPTQVPTLLPTMVPTNQPTQTLTNQPTQTPTNQPTQTPLPTLSPTISPTSAPTVVPESNAPTRNVSIPGECNYCTFTQIDYTKACKKVISSCTVAKSMWSEIQPGCLLTACFDTPIVLGSLPGFTVTFTTVKAITRFLPDKKTPSVFTKNLVNPPNTPAGEFAGHLLATILNAKFYGLGDIAFSSSCSNVDTRFAGMSIVNLIELSHQVISGQRTEELLLFTPDILSNALAVYNQAFNNCIASNDACFVCSTQEDPIFTSNDTTIEDTSFYPLFVYFIFLAFFLFLVFFVKYTYVRPRR